VFCSLHTRTDRRGNRLLQLVAATINSCIHNTAGPVYIVELLTQNRTFVILKFCDKNCHTTYERYVNSSSEIFAVFAKYRLNDFTMAF